MADNHFLQGQWRNIARVQIILGRFDEAEVVLDELNENARRLRLTSDLNRNLLLSNTLYWQTERKGEAQKALIESLTLANRTGFISHFVIEGEAMAQQLRQLIQLNALPELEQHRAQRILKDINQHHRHNSRISTNFVDKLLTHPQVPELIRTSPLTQREWQVLGLIYSGYSNDQIANELDVAATTIKRISVICIKNWASLTGRKPYNKPNVIADDGICLTGAHVFDDMTMRGWLGPGDSLNKFNNQSIKIRPFLYKARDG